MTQAGAIDPRLLAAVIGAGVVGLGWLVTELRGRMAARRNRRERERDVQMALMAEIEPNLETLELFDLSEYLERLTDRMRADASFIPFVPQERNDTVFLSMVSEIHVLPEPVIKPVVRYYSQLFAIDGMIDDLRSEGFRALSPERREAVYTDYISMKAGALKFGRLALESIREDLRNR